MKLQQKLDHYFNAAVGPFLDNRFTNAVFDIVEAGLEAHAERRKTLGPTRAEAFIENAVAKAREEWKTASQTLKNPRAELMRLLTQSAQSEQNEFSPRAHLLLKAKTPLSFDQFYILAGMAAQHGNERFIDALSPIPMFRQAISVSGRSDGKLMNFADIARMNGHEIVARKIEKIRAEVLNVDLAADLPLEAPSAGLA